MYETFQGIIISEKLTVLAPTKDFYLQLLVESHKTPLEERETVSNIVKEVFQKSLDKPLKTWKEENLREDVETAVENEMSVVIL